MQKFTGSSLAEGSRQNTPAMANKSLGRSTRFLGLRRLGDLTGERAASSTSLEAIRSGPQMTLVVVDSEES